jgi:hypothetical protein
MGQREREVSIRILVDPERFDAAVRALSDAGVQVDQALREVGAVTGRVTGGRLAALQSLDGVLAVEPEREVRISPPDSDLQ